MKRLLFRPKDRITHPTKRSEERIEQVPFKVHKFNKRPKPKDKSRVLIIACFSEFGCEIVGRLYCIPRLLKRFPGRYIIIMGWHGREYLYRHLADEFWEVDESCMWLRDFTYAFHHISDNLKRLEQSAAIHGTVVPSAMLGKYLIGNYCATCGKFWNEWRLHTPQCPACKSTVLVNSVLSTTEEYKKTAIRVPKPSLAMMDWAKGFMKPKTVAIFARGRRTYGRNLPPEFYVKLISQLESKGYNCIWLGEKQSTQACPVDHVYDFSRCDESRDLEKTLAIISQCEFTIQFWTASSRLAGLMGTPYILFESPEQIFCSGFNPGQEGKRLELTTFGPRKLVLSHYLNVMDNQDLALEYVDQAVSELVAGNTKDIIGLIENKEATQMLSDEYYKRTVK